MSIYIQLMPSRGRPWQNCQACTCIKELECELRRKDKALAEKAALLVLSKSSRRPCGRGADEQVHGAGGRLRPVVELVGLGLRTLWKASGGSVCGDQRPEAGRQRPVHALYEAERACLLL